MGDRVKGCGYWKKSVYVKKGLTGYWSKYGGARQMDTVDTDNWVCQSCGYDQWVLPQFTFPLTEEQNEFVRICARCKYQSRVSNVNIFQDLIELVRKPFGIEGYGINLANLLTLPLH